MKDLFDTMVSFPSYPGEEKAVQSWLSKQLSDLGFQTYEWQPDADLLESHPSFPPSHTLELADRPSIAGVLELGTPGDGPTIVLNGHADVVPVDETEWTTDPFDPRWEDGRVYGRGTLDMKGGLVACIFAARSVFERSDDLDGRIVVESVVGEEEGGIGAVTAAGNNPYPFERDAGLIAEPTDFDIAIATEGSLMKRLEIDGQSAHAARAWEGESVLPHFERIRRAFKDLERERAERVTHSLYQGLKNPWPVTFGTVTAGKWASTVPSTLTAEIRLGVAPHETVSEVEAAYQQRLDQVRTNSEWLSAHPPRFTRFSVQFEGAEVGRDEPVVRSLAHTIQQRGAKDLKYTGFTAGTDARHYIEAGIPTVVFGPGSPDTAHQSNEAIEWADVVASSEIIADATASALETM